MAKQKTAIDACSAGVGTSLSSELEIKERLCYQAVLLRNVFDPIISTDTDFRVRTWNAAAERVYGWKEAEVLGRDVDELLQTFFGKGNREESRERLFEAGSVQVESIHQARDGRRLHVRSNVTVLRDNGGRVTGTLGVLRDVTAEKLAEEQLRQRGEELAAALDTLPAYVWVALDSECRAVTGNRAANDLTGVAPGTNVSQSVVANGHAPYLQQLKPDGTEYRAQELPLQQAIATRQPVRAAAVEFAFADGRRVHTVGDAVPLFDAAGRVRGAVAAFFDITERRRAEQELRVAEERFRRLCEAGTIGIITADLQRITFANDAFLKMVGYSREDLDSGRILWQSITPVEHLAEDQRALAELIERGSCRPFEKEYMHKAGHRVPIRLGAARLTQEPLAWICFVEDLTEQQKTERALREAEERLRAVLDATGVGLWLNEMPFGVLTWDKRTKELFFVPPDIEPTIDLFWSRLHPDDREPTRLAVEAALRDRTLYAIDHRAVDPVTGRVRWIHSEGRGTYDGRGNLARFDGVNYDITHRREFQAELERLVAERTERLQELVGELEHFSYTITHDMRAPLRAMRGFAEVMAQTLESGGQERQRDYLDRITTAAERMDGLITDALSYSKAVRQDLPLAPVDLARLLRGMVDTYPELQSARADIRVPRELPLVMGNEAGLTQCFSNLLGNAVKFLDAGKRPEVRVRSELRDGWVRIWVEDNGIGISDALKPRLFGMFARGTNPQAGTGIGLALVRKVVDRMGGKVGVESEVGRGSRFWVELRPGDVRLGSTAAKAAGFSLD
jgi:PAS domain S-box-containing protein